MKYVSIDIETTGLNPETCSIIEFGAVIDDLSCLNPIDKLPKFQRYVNIAELHNLIVGEPYALSMHGEIFKRLAEHDIYKYKFCDCDRLTFEFSEFLLNNKIDQPINVAGKNFSGFDIQFLRRLPNWNIRIHYRTIDPAILFLEPTDNNMPDTKTCKERAGFTGEVAHTAIEDCLDIIQLVRRGLLRKWKE